MHSLFGAALGLSPPQFLAIAAALMIPTVWLTNLSAYSLLGVFGVAATTTVVALVSGLMLLPSAYWNAARPRSPSWTVAAWPPAAAVVASVSGSARLSYAHGSAARPRSPSWACAAGLPPPTPPA